MAAVDAKRGFQTISKYKIPHIYIYNGGVTLFIQICVNIVVVSTEGKSNAE
jgi:hypothetical protein